MVREKVILVDCDGVLLDWDYAFGRWMAKHDYPVTKEGVYNMGEKYSLSKVEKSRLIRMFNESAVIRKLPPLRDAIKYVRKLHQDHGYVFHAITSLSNDDYAQHLRTKNLIELFGPTTFEKYIYLDTGADKDEALEPYANSECYWIEDKIENAHVGKNLGLDAMLMDHDYNRHDKEIRKVRNWKEIYNIITQ